MVRSFLKISVWLISQFLVILKHMFINKFNKNVAIAVILSYNWSLYDLPRPRYKNRVLSYIVKRMWSKWGVWQAPVGSWSLWLKWLIWGDSIHFELQLNNMEIFVFNYLNQCTFCCILLLIKTEGVARRVYHIIWTWARRARVYTLSH